MFSKNITSMYAIASFLLVLSIIVFNVEGVSVSQTSENGVKTTEITSDDGKKTVTQETDGVSPGPIVGNTRVKVTEYYETLCPGCRKFFSDLFKPNYRAFRDYIEFILVPYGFAEIAPDGSITCQHDEPECLGNKYQACMLKLGKSEDIQLEYITCVMTTDGVEALTLCGSAVENFAEIETCAKGEDGIKYLKELGDLTNQLQPPLEYVPKMFIEGEALTEEEENFLYNDFVSFMCGKLPSVKPKCCGEIETLPSPEGSTTSERPKTTPDSSPASESSSSSPDSGPASKGVSSSSDCSPSLVQCDCSPSPLP